MQFFFNKYFLLILIFLFSCQERAEGEIKVELVHPTRASVHLEIEKAFLPKLVRSKNYVLEGLSFSFLYPPIAPAVANGLNSGDCKINEEVCEFYITIEIGFEDTIQNFARSSLNSLPVESIHGDNFVVLHQNLSMSHMYRPRISPLVGDTYVSCIFVGSKGDGNCRMYLTVNNNLTVLIQGVKLSKKDSWAVLSRDLAVFIDNLLVQ